MYLDKDTLIGLSKQIFKVAHEEYNRSSPFFEENVRDYEYQVIVDLAMEALNYDDTVLINAPFTKEIRDKKFIADMRSRLQEKNAVLMVVWVETSIEVCHERMIKRGSDRDSWKLAHWDDYIAGCNFTKPDIDGLLIFKNSTDEEFEASLKETVDILSR